MSEITVFHVVYTCEAVATVATEWNPEVSLENMYILTGSCYIYLTITRVWTKPSVIAGSSLYCGCTLYSFVTNECKREDN